MVMTRPLPRRRSLPRRRVRRFLSAYFKLRGGKPAQVVVFDASHFKQMLLSGQSEKAHYNLQCFLKLTPVQDWSPVSEPLLHQVGLFKIFATVARGGKEGAELASMFHDLSEEDALKNPACDRQIKMIARMNAHPTWALKVWQHVEPIQVGKIMESVSGCPDLQREVPLPRKKIVRFEPTTPWLCRKKTNHVPAHVIVREFQKKRLLTAQEINDPDFLSSASSSMESNMKSEQIALKPINLAGVPSNASSSSLAVDTQIEQNAPGPITLGDN